LGRLSKDSDQVQGSVWFYVTNLFFMVKCCLFNIFAATLHSWRPFLHPQPEDAPCHYSFFQVAPQLYSRG
jgi:hypothetical protein